MGEYYNVDRHTIEDYAKSIEFDTSSYKKKKLVKEQIDMIIENYNKYSVYELSQIMGVSAKAIGGVWHRYKLKGKVNRIYHLLNEDYFENIDCGNKAYFIGFICADGCLYSSCKSDKQKILRLMIHKKDIKILEVLRTELDTNMPIHTSRNTYVSIEISSDKIFSDFEKMGISPNKTYSNTIAKIPEKFMSDFIRGYFDGDGSISEEKRNTKNINISISGYEDNMTKLQKYLEKQCIYSSVIIDKRKYNQGSTGHFCFLCISNRTSQYSFLKLIYQNKNNCYLDRKYEMAKKFIDYVEESNNVRDKQIVTYYKYAVQKVS